jgi:hypothetical protein
MRENYEPPTLEVIGTLHELTLQVDKDLATTSDGFTFRGQPIYYASND